MWCVTGYDLNKLYYKLVYFCKRLICLGKLNMYLLALSVKIDRNIVVIQLLPDVSKKNKVARNRAECYIPVQLASATMSFKIFTVITAVLILFWGTLFRIYVRNISLQCHIYPLFLSQPRSRAGKTPYNRLQWERFTAQCGIALLFANSSKSAVQSSVLLSKFFAYPSFATWDIH